MRGSGCSRPGPGPVLPPRRPACSRPQPHPLPEGSARRFRFSSVAIFSIPAQREPFSQTKHPAALPGRTAGARNPRSVSLRVGWGALCARGTLSCWEKRGRQVPGERHGPGGTALCLLPARLRPHDKVRWGGRRRKEQSSGLSRFGSRFSESLWCSPRGVGRGYGSETSLCFSTLTSCRSVNETVRQYVGSLSIFIQPLQKTEMRCTVKYHSRCRDRVADKEIPLC